MTIYRCGKALVALVGAYAVLSGVPTPAPAQGDSVTVAAGARYAAGGTRRSLLGSDYRQLWTTPIRVPVLDPDTFAGGLTPLEEGGGLQTVSLHLQGADGREYGFRSVDKDQDRAVPPDVRRTVVSRIIQDQVSALHPGGALVADRLLDAVGILHASPRLYVMPDHPFLGEHREKFAGMLGTLEVRPNEGGEGEPSFAGADEVVGTEKFLEELEDTPRNRLDAREYLGARLMDLFLGDFDRHEDQWRWAGFDRGELRVWRPIPRDRDYVFVDYDGLLLSLGSRFYPKLVRFDDEYRDLGGLTENAQALDRRLLSGLARPAWDSVTAAVQRRLTDAVIRDAVERLPAPWYELSGPGLIADLRSRRDRLPEVAEEFYERLAGTVTVDATDVAERAEVERFPDGGVELRIYARKDAEGVATPHFRRRFVAEETEEVRLDLHGGDDTAVVRGHGGRGITLRVIGGGGDDVLADSTGGAGRSRIAFYDARGENRFVTTGGATVDRREYDEPKGAPRDRGRSSTLFSPWAGWVSNLGPVIGGGPQVTRYGFRRDPFASRLRLLALYAPFEGRVGVEATGEFHSEGAPRYFEVLAQASEIEATRFHGYGNESPGEGDQEFYRVLERVLLLEPRLVFPVSDRLTLSGGPSAWYVDPEPVVGSPAAEGTPFGSEAFGMVGARGGAEFDSRDEPAYPRHGWRASAEISAFPAFWDVEDAFAGVKVDAASYLTLPALTRPTLALRSGASRVWGGFPIQEAAALGGSHSLRGYRSERFLGDAAVWGNAELRVPVTRVNLLVRGDLGVLGLLDAGRVRVDGDSDGGWHTATGGGVWFAFLERRAVGSVTYAAGEEGRLYFKLGMPF